MAEQPTDKFMEDSIATKLAASIERTIAREIPGDKILTPS